MSAAEIRNHLRLLELERWSADATGLKRCEHYMRGLEEEVAEYQCLFVAAAVVEIAQLRAELSGPQVG
jgi:hypothetical protein